MSKTIYDLANEYDLSWQAIARILNNISNEKDYSDPNIYNDPIDEDTLRKFSYNFSTTIDIIIEKLLQLSRFDSSLITKYIIVLKEIRNNSLNNDDVTLIAHSNSIRTNIFELKKYLCMSNLGGIGSDEFLTTNNFINDLFIKIENAFNNYKKNIESSLSNKSNKEFLESHLLSLNDFISRKNIFLKDIDTAQAELDKLKDSEKELRRNIADSDQKLNRKKLAASFQNRSKILNNESFLWLQAIGGLLVFISITMIIMNFTLPDISKMNYDTLYSYIIGYLFHLPIALTLFWGLWFCCKQYSYTCHLRDDYHYKYDLSTAFYGYNEEVKKLADDDKTIQLALLDIVLKNIGKNPIDSKSIETDCNSPYTEGLIKIHGVLAEANKLLNKSKGASVDKKMNDDSNP